MIENQCGKLILRWRVFRQPIESSSEKGEKYTPAATALHNYLCQTKTASYTPSDITDSED